MENLILMFFFILSRGSCSSGESCDYKAVGETVQIPLFDQELESSHHLTWTQNNTRLYSKRGSSVWKNVGEVDVYGSLILENIQMNGSGEYKAEVFDGEGLRIKKTEHRLCVQEPVSKPSLQEQCSDAGVTLICCGRNSGELLVSWRNNTEKLTWNTSTVHLKASEITPGDSFSCSVRNMISEEWAEELQPSCSNKASNYAQGGPHHVTEKDEEHREDAADGASEDETPFLGLNWLLAAGGSFLIIFIIIVCVCCCCRRSSRKDKEENEYRLANLMPDYSNVPDPQNKQKIQKAPKGLRPLPPLPSPREKSYLQ